FRSTAVLTHAVHLLIMAMGGFYGSSVPIIGENSEEYADALPQALILTSIVISFAVTAFFLVLAYQVYKRTKTTDLKQLRGFRHNCFKSVDFVRLYTWYARTRKKRSEEHTSELQSRFDLV